MRLLVEDEIENIGGGFAVFGISGIETGLALFAQATAVGKAASISFAIGGVVGTAVSQGYTYFTGSTIGGDLYELIHC